MPPAVTTARNANCRRDADGDGCDTRKEVLLQEVVRKPKQGEDCKLTGGEWRSCYDGKTVVAQLILDIDHM